MRPSGPVLLPPSSTPLLLCHHGLVPACKGPDSGKRSVVNFGHGAVSCEIVCRCQPGRALAAHSDAASAGIHCDGSNLQGAMASPHGERPLKSAEGVTSSSSPSAGSFRVGPKHLLFLSCDLPVGEWGCRAQRPRAWKGPGGIADHENLFGFGSQRTRISLDFKKPPEGPGHGTGDGE